MAAVNAAARAIKVVKGKCTLPGEWKACRGAYSLPKGETGYAFGNLTAWDTALGWRYPTENDEMYGIDSMGGRREYC